MESEMLAKLFEFAKTGAAFFQELAKNTEKEVIDAIEKAKSSGGDTSELERVLNGE